MTHVRKASLAIKDHEHKRAKTLAGEKDNQHRLCPLLRLPPELRNAIYEHSLVQASPIVVTKDLKQPHLLSTCRQVRTEAKKIWYNLNKFNVPAWDCDASLLKHFHHFIVTAGGYQGVEVSVRVHGNKSWSNLVGWCQAVFDDDALAFTFTKEGHMPANEAVIQAAHKIAMTARTWAVCEEGLADLHFLVSKLDADWLL
ncbi:hypothetical protein LTR85_005555 [Meristemomyces frigidus]|nr:hypothetical protein LTR85_005555 [Meristemomyces frigidus]